MIANKKPSSPKSLPTRIAQANKSRKNSGSDTPLFADGADEAVDVNNGAKPFAKGELLRNAILDAASKLFIERGIGGTSIQDIAESLGLTRTAVYYYFKKKEDILQTLTEEVTLSAGRLAEHKAPQDADDPIVILHDWVRRYASHILARPTEFRVVDRNETELTDEHGASAQAARRAVLTKFRAIIERGVHSGHFRQVDPRVAAFSLIGMCNWTAWWYSAEGALTRDQVADTIADMAVHSLKREEHRRPVAANVQESLRVLREDLSYLEGLLKSPRTK